MKLSIITVCLNQPHIDDTCKSVVSQKWQDFEWIVIDGGSTDGTLEKLQKYADRIDVLVSEKDTGIYNAMNKGITRASGEWLCFLNGGDAFHGPEVLEAVFADHDYDCDILYGKRMQLHPDGRTLIEDYPNRIDKNYLIWKSISHQASFMRRRLFDAYGLYDETNRVVSDWEKHVQCFLGGCRFQKIDVVIADFRIENDPKVRQIMRRELEEKRNKYFSPQEIKIAKKLTKGLRTGTNPYTAKWRFRVFGLTLCSLTQSDDQLKMRYEFLGIPLLKVRKFSDDNSTEVDLLGFIPLTKRHRNS